MRRAVRIMVFVPRRNFWAVHKIVTSRPDLDRELEAVAGRKVRLLATTVRPPVGVKPAYVGPATRHRVEQAMSMVEQRDAKRYYKSPG